MPMRYPPLADGTYRYGDRPRPLPSPVPGPDTSTGPHPAPVGGAAFAHGRGIAHPGAPGQLSDPPPEELPREQRRPRGTVVAAATVAGLAISGVAVLGLVFFGGSGSDRDSSEPRGPYPQAGPSPGPGSGPLDVQGTFTVVSSPGEPVSGNLTGCDMPGSLADISEGTTISLYEADTLKVTTDELVYDGGDLASCTFTFRFPDVAPGSSIYMIELPGRGQLGYTEAELRAGVEITLGK